MLKHLIFSLASFCFLTVNCIQLEAQKSTSIENILSVQLNNIGAIRNGNDVAGYYLFYELDKIDKDRRSYMLQILDENLEQVSQKKIRQSVHVNLVDAAFNDTLIMFKFHDPEEKKYSLKAYDLLGQKARGGSRTLDKKKYYPALQGAKGEQHEGALYAVPGKGFVQYASVKNKKWGYIIDFIGPTREKSWKHKSSKTDSSIKMAHHITGNDQYLVSNITVASNMFGRDIRSNVLVLDVNTGKKVFETPFGEHPPTRIINGTINEDNQTITIFGLFYKDGGSGKAPAKAKSRGLFIYTLDMKGEIIDKKLLSWEEEFSKFLPINKKGKLKGSQYIEFHKFVKSNDGKTLIIGEKFGKEADAAGVATNLIGGLLSSSTGGMASAQGNMAKFVVEDLVILTLDANQNLESVEVIEKNKSEISLPGELMSPQLMAYYARKYNGFDYAFTQTNEDNSMVSFTYLDYQDRRGDKDEFTLGTINYADGELSTDAIELSEDSKYVKVLPAVPGYVAIAEIISVKKPKKKGRRKKYTNTLNFRLEKINY